MRSLLHPMFLSLCLASLVTCLLLNTGCTLSDARLGARLAQEGKWDEAVSAYRQAVKKDPYDEDLAGRYSHARTRAAEQHHALGRQHLKEGNIGAAIADLKLATGLDPSRIEHQAGLADALRLKEARDLLQVSRRLQGVGRIDDALAALEQALGLDPNLQEALDEITNLTAQKNSSSLQGKAPQPITLRFQNANLKEVFEIVARSAGINVIFDKDVQNEPITIFIKDLTYDQALNMILNTHQLASHRVGPSTLLILPNTKQKQAQYQDLMIRTFYLSNAKAKDVVNMVRAMLESKRVYVDEKINAIVIRDEPAKIMLAERVINSIDRQDPEVELDVEILEVDRTKSLKYGLNYAKSASAGIVPPGFTGALTTAPAQFTYRQLTGLGPDSYVFTFPGTVLLDFFKQDSDAKTLAAPKLRVLNNKQASINVGDKQPILLSTTNVLPGQAATGAVPTTSTVTSIEFKDVGVKLTVEPTIHLTDELTLKLKVEVTRLGDQITLQASPEIKQFKFGNRSAETVLLIKDDETVVLAGLLQNEQRRTRTKIPWIDQIPLLGSLLTSTTEDTLTTEVIVTITPHIVRKLRTPSLEAQAFWSGNETNYTTSPLFAGPMLTAAHGTGQQIASGVPQVPPGPARSPAPSSGGDAGQDPTSKKRPTQPLTVLNVIPGDLSTTIGQEFRLDISTPTISSVVGSVVKLNFDPRILRFLRADSGMAQISASTGPGQVDIAIQGRETKGEQGGTLATLFFQAVAQGDSVISVRHPNAEAQSNLPTAGQEAKIHVR